MYKKDKKGFTLVELMIVIAIIIILGIGITSIDFNRLSDKQRLEIFTNKVITKIENIRNYNLVGKGIKDTTKESGFINIKEWKIEINKNSGNIKVSIKREDGISFEDLGIESLKLNSDEIINKISCKTREESIINISFKRNDTTSIEECPDTSKLKMELELRKQKSKIEFDLVSGVIKKVRN